MPMISKASASGVRHLPVRVQEGFEVLQREEAADEQERLRALAARSLSGNLDGSGVDRVAAGAVVDVVEQCYDSQSAFAEAIRSLGGEPDEECE